MPPPIPCSTRKAIRLPVDQASPQRAEPATKSATETSHVRRAPKRPAAQPESGMTSDRARR